MIKYFVLTGLLIPFLLVGCGADMELKLDEIEMTFSQAELYQRFISETNHVLRQACMKKIRSTEFLNKIIKDEDLKDVYRENALKKLTDVADLKNLVLDENLILDYRLKAVDHIDKPTAIITLLNEKKLPEKLRSAALKKISNQALLFDIALAKDTPEELKKYARGEIKDTDLLLKLWLNTEDPVQKQKLLSKIDRSQLDPIYTSTKDEETRVAAVLVKDDLNFYKTLMEKEIATGLRVIPKIRQMDTIQKLLKADLSLHINNALTLQSLLLDPLVADQLGQRSFKYNFSAKRIDYSKGKFIVVENVLLHLLNKDGKGEKSFSYAGTPASNNEVFKKWTVTKPPDGSGNRGNLGVLVLGSQPTGAVEEHYEPASGTNTFDKIELITTAKTNAATVNLDEVTDFWLDKLVLVKLMNEAEKPASHGHPANYFVWNRIIPNIIDNQRLSRIVQDEKQFEIRLRELAVLQMSDPIILDSLLTNLDNYRLSQKIKQRAIELADESLLEKYASELDNPKVAVQAIARISSPEILRLIFLKAIDHPRIQTAVELRRILLDPTVQKVLGKIHYAFKVNYNQQYYMGQENRKHTLLTEVVQLSFMNESDNVIAEQEFKAPEGGLHEEFAKNQSYKTKLADIPVEAAIEVLLKTCTQDQIKMLHETTAHKVLKQELNNFL